MASSNPFVIRQEDLSYGGDQESYSDNDEVEIEGIRRIDLTAKIADMMYIFGDMEPRSDSVRIMRSIIQDQVNILLIEAERFMRFRDGENEEISHEDVIFIIRNNRVKIKRLLEYLRILDMQPLGFLNNEFDLESGGKRVQKCMEFLAVIENYGELTALLHEDISDPAFKRQLERRELRMNAMSMEEYKEFSEKSSNITFYVEKRGTRFKEWLLQDEATECDITPLAVSIIYFIARETVAQIVDHALLQKSRQFEQKVVYFINSPTQFADLQNSDIIHAFKNPVKETESSDKVDNLAGTSKKKTRVTVEITSDFPVTYQAENKQNKSVLEQYRDPTSLANVLPKIAGSKQDQIAFGKHSDPSSYPEILSNAFGNTQDNLTFEKYRDPSSPTENDCTNNVKVTDSSIFSFEIFKNSLDYRSRKSIGSDDSLSNSDSVNALVDEDSNIENKSNSDSNSMKNVLGMVFDIEKESMDVDRQVTNETENDKKKHYNEKYSQTEHSQYPLNNNYAAYATKNDSKWDGNKAPHAESFAPPADHDYIHTACAPGDEDDSADEDNVDVIDQGNVAEVCRQLLRSCINKVVRDLQNPFYRTAVSGGLFRIAPTASLHWSSGGLNAVESSYPYMPHQSEIEACHSKVLNVAKENSKEIEDDKNIPNDTAEDPGDEFSESLRLLGHTPAESPLDPMSDDELMTEAYDTEDSEYDSDESGLIDPITPEEIWNAMERFQAKSKINFSRYVKARRTKLICLNEISCV